VTTAGPLTHDQVLELHAALASAGLGASRSALLSGIGAGFVLAIPVAPRPVDQILCDLHALNVPGALADGSVPLEIWLKNAIALAPTRPEVALFMALQRIASAVGGAVRAAGLPPEVRAPAASARPSRPTPSYPDAETRTLSEKLVEALGRLKRLQQRGADTAAAVHEVLDVKRRLRDGGQLKAGDTLGGDRYLLLDVLGRGGFATVWRAHDETRDEDVAVKVLHSNLAGDRVRLDRFKRGARIMAELEHEAVVRVLEPYGEDGGWHYFVMEYVSGGDLRRAMTERRLGQEQAVLAILRVSGALAEAHARGIVHRDVKPANILLDAALAPKLADFDLVCAGDTTGGTRTGGLGTVIYAAPEVMTGAGDADARADVYGLGMTAAFCIHGSDLPGNVMGRVDRFIDRLSCSAEVRAVLKRATDWDEPAARHADAAEFHEALAGALKAASVQAVAVVEARTAEESAPVLQAEVQPSDVEAALDAPVSQDVEVRHGEPSTALLRAETMIWNAEEPVPGISRGSESAPSWWGVRQVGSELVFSPSPGAGWPSGQTGPGSPITWLLASEPRVLVVRGQEAHIAELGLLLGLSVPLNAHESLILGTDACTVTVHPWRRESWAVASGRDRFGLWADAEVKGVAVRFRWIPPGRFRMGSPEGEAGRYEDEGPRHLVTWTEGRWFADSPVTQALWEAVMGENPSEFKSADRPVEQVSWDDCQMFLQTLNRLAPRLAARLPSEAEWEQACRAGTEAATWLGELDIRGENDAPLLDAIAWYGGNAGVGFELAKGWDTTDLPQKQYQHTKGGTHPVRGKDPNPLGLYDMLGNVYEWCLDAGKFGEGYTEGDVIDPPAGRTGSRRVLRGGSWSSSARCVRAADRYARDPGYRDASWAFVLSEVRGQIRGRSPLLRGRSPLLRGRSPLLRGRSPLLGGRGATRRIGARDASRFRRRSGTHRRRAAAGRNEAPLRHRAHPRQRRVRGRAEPVPR
jgi:formylglycine-generating enzyme required for sulfatase activity